jgi:1,4-dihydroxy-2-naphthoate octaprenyltransferase
VNNNSNETFIRGALLGLLVGATLKSAERGDWIVVGVSLAGIFAVILYEIGSRRGWLKGE